jgi:hypothetical protein
MNLVNTAIDMVALFGKDGKVTPQRFRISGEDGEQVYKLYIKTIDCDKEKRIFHCMTEINGAQREVEIWYQLAKTKWILANIR